MAEARRGQIAAHFAARREITPSLWNGRVLLAHDYEVGPEGMRVSFFETDFASFLAWWEWGFPDETVMNCFSMGAIRSADGAFCWVSWPPGLRNLGAFTFRLEIPNLPMLSTDELIWLATCSASSKKKPDSHVHSLSLSRAGLRFWMDSS